ncbi:MAG: hypothetical protein GTO24_23580 [candidate division Zixibacteria bacterium]|nr:hypothetical protein [candidate division Zixibacteria bacterium]
MPEGYEILRGSMPALVTVSHEAGELRIPKLSEIRKSGEKAIHNLNTADLNLGEVPDRSIECIRLESPVIDRQCRFIDEDTPADAGIHLARIIVGMGY